VRRPNAALDPAALDTILTSAGVAALAERLRGARGLAFSFTRRDAEPERALRDLVLVIGTLAAEPGLEAAPARSKAGGRGGRPGAATARAGARRGGNGSWRR
jgi:hypothetical protein